MSRSAFVDEILRGADEADARAERLRALCFEVSRAMRRAIRDSRVDLEAVDDLTEG